MAHRHPLPFTVLVAENISVRFTLRHPPALDRVSAALKPGAITAIIGPNGSGKSTLIRVLAGLLNPQAGRVTLGDRPLYTVATHQRRRHIAYVPQRPATGVRLAVRDIVSLGIVSASTDTPECTAQVADALDRVGLGPRALDPFDTLSTGQQQRVTLARAIVQLGRAHRPAALLADEPTSAMDPAQVAATVRLLRDIAGENVAIGVALHDLTLADAVADACVLLSPEGRVHADGPRRDVLEPGTLAEVFGIPFDCHGDPMSGRTITPRGIARPGTVHA